MSLLTKGGPIPDEAFDDDYDGPWKEAMEHAPLHCLDFFFPDICEDIDVTEEYDSLSEELQKSFPAFEQSKRITDKFWTHEKDPLVIHGEIQTYWEADYADHMDICNWRVKERLAYWRAGCDERCQSGSGGGGWKGAA